LPPYLLAKSVRATCGFLGLLNELGQETRHQCAVEPARLATDSGALAQLVVEPHDRSLQLGSECFRLGGGSVRGNGQHRFVPSASTRYRRPARPLEPTCPACDAL